MISWENVEPIPQKRSLKTMQNQNDTLKPNAADQPINEGLDVTTCSAFATIRRQKSPCEYMGWAVEHDSPLWTSDRLSAAPVPLEILIDELNKVAARQVAVWAVVYPQNVYVDATADEKTN